MDIFYESMSTCSHTVNGQMSDVISRRRRTILHTSRK